MHLSLPILLSNETGKIVNGAQQCTTSETKPQNTNPQQRQFSGSFKSGMKGKNKNKNAFSMNQRNFSGSAGGGGGGQTRSYVTCTYEA